MTRPHVRCGICASFHYPKCVATDKVWPVADLAAIADRDALWSAAGRKPLPEFLSDVMADRWAVRCGFHPEYVWPGWCDAALTYGDRVFVEEGGWRQSWDWLEAQRVSLVTREERDVA